MLSKNQSEEINVMAPILRGHHQLELEVALIVDLSIFL